MTTHNIIQYEGTTTFQKWEKLMNAEDEGETMLLHEMGMPKGHQTLIVVNVCANPGESQKERAVRFVGSFNTPQTIKVDVVSAADGKIVKGLSWFGKVPGGVDVEKLGRDNGYVQAVELTYTKGGPEKMKKIKQALNNNDLVGPLPEDSAEHTKAALKALEEATKTAAEATSKYEAMSKKTAVKNQKLVIGPNQIKVTPPELSGHYHHKPIPDDMIIKQHSWPEPQKFAGIGDLWDVPPPSAAEKEKWKAMISQPPPVTLEQYKKLMDDLMPKVGDKVNVPVPEPKDDFYMKTMKGSTPSFIIQDETTKNGETDASSGDAS